MLTLNKNVDASALIDPAGIGVYANGEPLLITKIQIDPSNPNQLVITVGEEIFDNDIIQVSYSGDQISATDETPLQHFENLAVINNLPVHFTIPAKIEAEDLLLFQ